MSKAPVTRQRWTAQEETEIRIYFREFIKKGDCPGKVDCLRAIEISKRKKGALFKRDWETLKKKVYNMTKNKVEQVGK